MGKLTPEQSKRYYRYRLENGLCVLCSKKRDRTSSCLCNECTEKARVEANKTIAFRLSLGICPRCGKNRLFGDEKRCPECRAYEENVTYRWQENNPDRYKELLERKNEKQKQKRKERISKGLCTYCGKAIDEPRYKTCSKCRAKKRIKQQETRANKYKVPKTKIWEQKGYCVKCRNEKRKQGYKVCEECYNKMTDVYNSNGAIKYRNKLKQQEHNRFIQYQERCKNDKY